MAGPCRPPRGIAVLVVYLVILLMPQNVHFIGPFNAETTTWWDLLTLYGIRSHMGYGGEGSEVEVNCFDVVVPWLYQGDRALA